MWRCFYFYPHLFVLLFWFDCTQTHVIRCPIYMKANINPLNLWYLCCLANSYFYIYLMILYFYCLAKAVRGKGKFNLLTMCNGSQPGAFVLAHRTSFFFDNPILLYLCFSSTRICRYLLYLYLSAATGALYSNILQLFSSYFSRPTQRCCICNATIIATQATTK